MKLFFLGIQTACLISLLSYLVAALCMPVVGEWESRHQLTWIPVVLSWVCVFLEFISK